ncbi:MAG TPA: hypothetical protein VK943_00945 [Arenibaculum sp.]|nr:hypothetical protein [Arenibaculum sp.]
MRPHRSTRSIGMLAVLAAGTFATVATRADAGNLRLVGTVAQTCTVSLSDAGMLLDLAGAARTVAVATVEETCNAPVGYTVSISSRNGGRLVAEGGASVPYTLLYDGNGDDGHGGLVARRSAPGRVVHELSVLAGGAGNLVAGSYDDVVTVTIEAR